MTNFMTSSLHQISLGLSIEEADMSGSCAHIGDVRNVYKILVVKTEGKRPFWKCRHR
jgi:hypothetical protein